MGTYAENTRTYITLDLTKMQQGYLNRTPEFKAVLENVGRDWSDTFQEVITTLVCESKVDQDRLIVTRVADECKIGWQDGYFAILAPFAQEGDYAEFRCPEYGTWRYIRHGGKFIEQEGVVKVEYPPLPALTQPKAKARKAKRG